MAPQKTKMKFSKILIASLVIISSLSLAGVKAEDTSVSCSDLVNSVVNIAPQDMSGSVYVKLPKYASVDSSQINIYRSVPTLGARCNLIASVKANKNTWLKIGDNLKFSQGDEITIDGQGLGAEVYAASAYLLIVQSNACAPSAYCDFSDSFGSGYLEPKIVSSDTDQIAIYVASPLQGLKPTSFNYYDNGRLLYVLNNLKRFNVNYLSGGKHNIDIQAKYSNNENLHYISQIDTGQDWSKWLLIRSTYYKLKTPAKIIALVISGILILLLILLIYRIVRNKIKASHDHGVDNYTPEDQPPIDPGNSIITG